MRFPLPDIQQVRPHFPDEHFANDKTIENAWIRFCFADGKELEIQASVAGSATTRSVEIDTELIDSVFDKLAFKAAQQGSPIVVQYVDWIHSHPEGDRWDSLPSETDCAFIDFDTNHTMDNFKRNDEWLKLSGRPRFFVRTTKGDHEYKKPGMTP